MAERRPADIIEFIQVFLTFGITSYSDSRDITKRFHEELVVERKWVSEASFRYIIEFCELLPGMYFQKIAIHLGWYIWGIPGGLLAGLLYVLPGSILLLFLAGAHSLFGMYWWCAALYLGLGPAAIVILLHTILTYNPGANASKVRLIGFAAFVALYLFHAPFLIVLSAALVFGIKSLKPQQQVQSNSKQQNSAETQMDESEPLEDVEATAEIMQSTLSGVDQAAFTLLLCVFWLTPIVVLLMAYGTSHPLVQLTFIFFQSVLFSFGEAQGIFAYLAEQIVLSNYWIDAVQFVHGFSLATAFPGPPLLALQYIGFKIGFALASNGPLAFMYPFVSGIVVAFLGFWVAALPSFFWVFTLAPISASVRSNQLYYAISQSIKSVLFGGALYLTCWLIPRIYFRYSLSYDIGPLSIEIPMLHTLYPDVIQITIVGLFVRFFLKKPNTTVVQVCMLMGFIIACLERFEIEWNIFSEKM